MDSRQRFVIVLSSGLMIPFVVFTFLNTTDLGLYVASFTVVYFALMLGLNPKIRWRVDILAIVLLALFTYFVAERIIGILSGTG
ncbi:MAG: hypothetical protein ACYCQJ_01475 [Nitrososphaerales archaeon]